MALKKLGKAEKNGLIMTIGFDSPEVRNAVNRNTALQLLEAFTTFERDKAWTAAAQHGTDFLLLIGPVPCEVLETMIAAMISYAVAEGLELALLADLCVIENSAIMGVFCRQFGASLINGSTVRLPQLIELSSALDLILTCHPISAQEAYEFGFANRIVQNG
ncbi:uncharacterized protein [Scyliorhinus torazame]|uniref:uncharacterized protein n=1 Tax=Scyliorhinus torazame TaxID=75743 RepID=UPI003B59668C